MLQTVVPLWLASFFPALGLGLGLYTFTHRLPRNTPLSVTRPIKVYRTMTDTQTYVMLITAICLFAVNYRILPISPLVIDRFDPASDILIMTVVRQHAFVGVLGMVVVFLQAWLILQKKRGSRRNLSQLAASLLVVGLFIPWTGCLGLMPISRIGDKVEERKEIRLSPVILEQYVGTYEIQPGVDMTITLEAGQLFTQITGRPKFPLFPESENKFFLKIVNSRHEYIKDDIIPL